MIIDQSDYTDHQVEQLVVVRCPLCGGRRGAEFDRFATHVGNDHDWSDLVGVRDVPAADAGAQEGSA